MWELTVKEIKKILIIHLIVLLYSLFAIIKKGNIFYGENMGFEKIAKVSLAFWIISIIGVLTSRKYKFQNAYLNKWINYLYIWFFVHGLGYILSYYAYLLGKILSFVSIIIFMKCIYTLKKCVDLGTKRDGA